MQVSLTVRILRYKVEKGLRAVYTDPKKGFFLHTVVTFLFGPEEKEVCICKFRAPQILTAAV